MRTWHIITCEYPPQIGGVSDYTGLLAHALHSGGDDVHVWAPSETGQPDDHDDGGVHVHRWLGEFSKADLAAAEQQMKHMGSAPRTLLVQWVPHGFRHRAMNLGFCHWLKHLVKNGDRLELMIHEPYLEFGNGSWKQRVVSLVQHRMIRIVLEAASRVYMAIPAWESYLRPYAPSSLEMNWMPIPATVPVADNKTATCAIRKGMHDPAVVLGHLGTYSPRISSVLQDAILGALGDVPNSHALLLGVGNKEFVDALGSQKPEWKARFHAGGVLAKTQLSHHLSACDLMLQPYPDGLSTRRTSLMNALAHGVAVASNSGHLTEDFWEHSGAVALGATGTGSDLAKACVPLLLDSGLRKSIGTAGAKLYASKFDWPNVISILRSTPDLSSARAKSN